MKRFLLLILAVLFSCSLVACVAGEKADVTKEDNINKFVGTYTKENDGKNSFNSLKETLVLNEDGTGFSKSVITKVPDDDKFIAAGWQIGDIQEESTLTWESDGEYVTINWEIKTYYEIFPFIRRHEPILSSNKETYELKAGQLVTLGGTVTGYYKES